MPQTKKNNIFCPIFLPACDAKTFSKLLSFIKLTHNLDLKMCFMHRRITYFFRLLTHITIADKSLHYIKHFDQT